MREFVPIKCDNCDKDMGFAVNPRHIPKLFCEDCYANDTTEKEYEHNDG